MRVGDFKSITFPVFVIGLLFANLVFSQPTVNWEGNVSADWNDKNNWQANTLPLSTDDVLIDPGNYTIAPIISANSTAKRTGVLLANLSGSWFVGSTDKLNSPLPVILLSFAAELVDNTQVALVWVTASEINNDHFTIERSTNGLTFTEIIRVSGAGDSNSELEYEAYDDSPAEGISYYRLKQTDFDGTEETFTMVVVNFEKNSDGSCILRVFPNPCIGQCTIDLSECEHNESAEIKVEMIDALGNLVYSKIPYRQFDGSFQFSIDSSNNLKPGVYIVRGASQSESYTKKVIVK